MFKQSSAFLQGWSSQDDFGKWARKTYDRTHIMEQESVRDELERFIAAVADETKTLRAMQKARGKAA
eukprot:15003380-Alexandrium_andersonii.AAC.1